MYKTFSFQVISNLVSANLIILGMFFLAPSEYLEIQFVTATMAIAGIMHIGIIDGMEIRLIQSYEENLTASSCSFYALTISTLFILISLISIFFNINISQIGLIAGLFVCLTNLYTVRYKIIGEYDKIVKYLTIDKIILILAINIFMITISDNIKYAFLFQFFSLLIFLKKEKNHTPLVSTHLFSDIKVGFPLMISNLATIFLLAGLIFLYQDILEEERLSALAFAALISSIAIGFSSQLGNIVLGRLRNKAIFPIKIKILFLIILSFGLTIFLFENYKHLLIMSLMNKELLIYFYYFIPIAIMEFINFMFLLPINKIKKELKKIILTPIICFALFIIFKSGNINTDLIMLNLLILAKTIIYSRGISVADFNFISKF